MISKKDKGRILDEFTAITGHHRKHGIRLLGGTADNKGKQALGRRIYDEAVREAVIVVWEASDRICGKRLKAALPNFVDSMERHGHLSLDPAVRERLHSASAATLDRLLKPIRCWTTWAICLGGPQGAAESEVLFTLMAERYERRAIGITSNLVFSQWDQIFQNPMATAAAINRVVHHSVILGFDVPSYRTREAQGRQQNATDNYQQEEKRQK